MTELALRSTSETTFVEVDPGSVIGAVRADGGEVEVSGRERGGGGERSLRLRPTGDDLGWVTLPENVAWTRFRAVEQDATCTVELVPRERDA
ncbi:hypothetical protein [Benzoatithermus flavus]|uniref:Uncharacterized protein n=1 Tax=Benzoatithermus flavus TaxID=3108223 RepID=A0ABU8XQ49_9PROT